MTPIKFRLEGAIGIQAGLNREVLEMDFSRELPADAITVAVRGDNGRGKSTILNLALVPWREPPHVRGGSLYNEFGPKGLRELEWEHNGTRYLSRIEIRQTPKTKSMKAYLYEHSSGDWQPVTLADHTTSDGKGKTYDACLEQILGPQSLYYLAAFRAQGAAKLGEHDDPKGLMRDLLGLERPQQLRELARAVARELKRGYEGLRATVERVAELNAEMEGVGRRIEEMHANTDQQRMDKQRAEEQLILAKRRYNEATEAESEILRVQEQRRELEQRLAETSQRESKRSQEALGALEQAKREAAATLARATEQTATIQGDIDRARQRGEQARSMLARSDEIKRAADAVANNELALEAQERNVQTAAWEVDRARELSADVREVEASLVGIGREGKDLAARADDLKNRGGFVDRVPCRGEGEYAECPALQDALRARQEIPATVDALEGAREQYRQENAKREALQIKKQALAGAEAKHKDAVDALNAIKTELQRVRPIANELAALEQAEQTVADADAEAARMQERLVEHQREAEAASEQRETRLRELAKRLETVQDEGRQAVAVVQAQLDALPAPDADGVLAAARARLAEAEARAEQTASTLEQHLQTIAHLEADRKHLQEQIARNEETRQRAEEISQEIAHWELLAAGLQGVVDLSIEDAGPTIAATANHLLREAYGPRFSVRIVTQREQANGRLVETFDISVIDAETEIDGRPLEVSVLAKSGGEAVWIDKALTDSVGLYHQETAGGHYETLFADEAEDGLTQERKARFYAMDRAALEMGGFRRKFFISHNPDAWTMADAVIDLEQLADEVELEAA